MGFENEVEQSLGRPSSKLTAAILHFIHRPVRDTIPPPGGVSSFYHLILYDFHAAATSRVHGRLGAVTHMRCMITANRRASASRFYPRCLAIFIAQALSQDHFVERTSTIWAAS